MMEIIILEMDVVSFVFQKWDMNESMGLIMDLTLALKSEEMDLILDGMNEMMGI